MGSRRAQQKAWMRVLRKSQRSRPGEGIGAFSPLRRYRANQEPREIQETGGWFLRVQELPTEISRRLQARFPLRGRDRSPKEERQGESDRHRNCLTGVE